MSAQHIYDSAPLGSLIRFSNGEPRPPARFTRKLRAWNEENGMGRLVDRSAGRAGVYPSPATFSLHLGNYGSQGTIVMVVRRIYTVDSALQFEIAEQPKALKDLNPSVEEARRIVRLAFDYQSLCFALRKSGYYQNDLRSWMAEQNRRGVHFGLQKSMVIAKLAKIIRSRKVH